MHEKKNVLIVHNFYQIPGGEDTVVANEKNLLEKKGHKVVLYTRSNSEIKKMGALKKILLPFSLIFNFKTYRDVRKIIKEQNIEIVHVHNTLSLISPSVYYAAFSLGIPVVQTVHNFRLVCPAATFYRDNNICEDCLTGGLRCALKHGCYRNSRMQTMACVISMIIHRLLGTYRKTNFICLTEFTKKKLLEINHKKEIIREDSVYVKPNFTYENTIAKRQGGYFLFIGRIEQIKGIDILIEAFSQLPDKKLLIAGTGSEFKKYKALADKAENIEFLGFLEREKLNNIISGAKAVIVTSQWYETFGMIIAEAFASHIPVITGDIGNIGALVEDGVDGFKFIYNSAQSLKETIIRFDSEYDDGWGDNAYREYVEKYSPDENYRQLNEIYEKIIEKNIGQ